MNSMPPSLNEFSVATTHEKPILKEIRSLYFFDIN